MSKQTNSEQSAIEEMMRAHDGGEGELRRKIASARERWQPADQDAVDAVRRDTERAKLAQLEDWKRRAIQFDGWGELLGHQQMHRFHKDEPYIGCLFCRDKFMPVSAHVEAMDRLRETLAPHQSGQSNQTNESASDWQRAGGKDYGWAFGIPGVVVVEIWYPPGVERWTLPWSDDDLTSLRCRS